MQDSNNRRPRVGDSRPNTQNSFSNNGNSNIVDFMNEFKKEWITIGADKEMVTFVEKAGKYMARNGLTNSKIRSIYGEIKRIQMSEFEKEKTSFYLLKPKVAYALGRDGNNQGLKLFKEIFDNSFPYVTDTKTYKNFCNLIEAVLAYHKAYGGKD